MKTEVIGSILGLIVGIVFFGRLPSFIASGLLVLFSVILGAFSGFIGRKYGLMKATIVPILFLILVLFFSISTLCTLEGYMHPPAENKLTGETVSGGFDGFRVTFGCDKGFYPWYYDELNEQKAEEYCKEKNFRSAYCSEWRPY